MLPYIKLNLYNFIQHFFVGSFKPATTQQAYLENDILVVPNGIQSHYFPSIWLRDNCQCPKCFNEHAQARLVLMKDLDLEIRATNIVDCGSQVLI